MPPERILRGIRATLYDEGVGIVEIRESAALPTAFRLRSMLSNFIDCLILSSAMNQCKALVTEDEGLQKAKENKIYREVTSIKNPNFKILRPAEIA